MFSPLKAQFKLCYEAVSTVLNSFDEYSNFAGTESSDEVNN